jgi:hypothetical protein
MEDPAAAVVLGSGSGVQLELPAYELAGHIRHAVADVAPTETEYVPALQLMHSEAPTPAYLPA